ncbi:hypothetical protein F5Y15DRAFT_388500 [Xylariaceae sp. FL0016]|nr:hypothetical protein F5Y15DRAFT_388500 [Xylariaceae sp. FL0016]
MHYRPASRRAILVSSITIFILISATFHYTISSHGILIPTPPTAGLPSECQVWPDWQGSSREYSPYKLFQGTRQQPSIGLDDVLGSPWQCLHAPSRLDRYRSTPDRNWSELKWGHVQRKCIGRKYKLASAESKLNQAWRRPVGPKELASITDRLSGREAVVLRAWDNYEYTEKRLAWLRSLISEVSLHQEGRYQVFLLVNVKDPNVRLEEDGDAYEQALRDYVPREFRDMAVLYNERTLKAWYPQVREHGAQDQMYQALQIFSHKFPQYDYVCQLEMDLRFTGHVHEALESATRFARSQSRRHLWERNGAFYIPGLHGSFENFTSAVGAEVGDGGVWGPVATADVEPKGPKPPSRSKGAWGVGEDADLISFMPMIDPIGTNWVYEDDVYGFNEGLALPRRLAVVSVTRSSRRLLHLVSEAQREKGQWLVSEATLETFALLHGLKAVSVPQPVYIANDKTMEKIDAEINPGPVHSKAGGHMPSILYSKQGWLMGSWWQASYWFTGEAPGQVWDTYLGGKCLPPMMIHPVKEK